MIVYVCASCRIQSEAWMSSCPACGALGKFDAYESGPPGLSYEDSNVPVVLATVNPHEVPRYRSGIEGFDRVLGGGLVRGSVVLIGGEPGIGKSTLILQACLGYARAGLGVLYVTAEETLEHIKLRADRIGDVPRSLLVYTQADLGAVQEATETYRPRVLILDSVQTVYSTDVEGVVGGIVQVSEVAHALVELSRERKLPMILVSHVTKDGDLAGPRGLEHIVDVVLHFGGDRTEPVRELYAVKNRFGPIGERAILEMTERGLLPFTSHGSQPGHLA